MRIQYFQLQPLPQMLPCKATYQHDFRKIDLIVHYYEHSYLQAHSEEIRHWHTPKIYNLYTEENVTHTGAEAKPLTTLG
ncbi:hypothetical protein D3C80_812860 [compost metagenome]